MRRDKTRFEDRRPPEARIGDAPIEPEYHKMMEAIARTLDQFINGVEADGETVRKPRKTGFVLLLFPFGEREGRCNYISNGANREDITKLLEEQAARFKADIAKDRKGEPS